MMWKLNNLMKIGLILPKKVLDFKDGEILGDKFYVRS